MALNRYTDLSVSAYNPMSMEELAVAPMMKRKQHDELDKQLAEAVVKVDPLKYHEEEALRLKNELEGKVASQAEQLASQGITPDSKSSFYKLNKEYRDLTAPTGQVGKINRAKEIYDKEHAAFIKNAMETSKIGGDVAEQRWNEYVAKNYTGYEDPEQKRVKYIDPLGAVAYQDQDKDLALAHNILGNYSKEIGDAGYTIGADPVTGLMGVINSKGQTVTKHNLGRVQEALDAYNLKWVDPKGEGRKWSDFAGQNAANNAERFRHQFNSMKIYNTGREYGESFNPLSGQGDGSSKPPTTPTQLQEAAEVQNPIIKHLDELNSTSVKEIFSQFPAAWSNLKAQLKNKKVSSEELTKQDYALQQMVKDKLSPAALDAYTTTYNIKIAQGLIPKGEPMFGAKAQKVIKNDWAQQKDFAWSNNVVLPDSEENDILASPQLVDAKTPAARNAFAQKRFDLARKNKQTLFYDEEGNKIDLSDVNRKSIELVGHYNPANMLKTFGGSDDNTVSPHIISYEDSDGESHTALMPRDANEKITNNYKAAQIINKTIRKSVVHGNGFVSFTDKDFPILKAKGLDKIRVKFDSTNKTFTVEAPGVKYPPMTQEQYSDFWYNNLN